MTEPRTCSIADCGRPIYARNYCSGHYARSRRAPHTLHDPVRLYQDTTIRDEKGRKQCLDCQRWLSEAMFIRNTKTTDRLFWYCSPCRSIKRRDSQYNLAPGQFDSMLAAQRGLCAICKSPESGKAWNVDHDHSCCPKPRHSCGKCVRGILCTRCNFAIGHFLDNPDAMRAGAQYVESYRVRNAA